MPFVIGKIATTMGSYNNPLVPPFNQMQQRVADTMTNVYTVETSDLIVVKSDGTFMGRDQYHFAYTEMVTLGLRFAEKLKPLTE